MTRALYVLALALLLGLTACDKVTRSEVLYTGTPQKAIVSCSHFAYCMACGLGMDGKFNCLPKFSAFCPGQQDAVVQDVTVRDTYKSGKQGTYTRRHTLRTTGACH